MSLVGPFSKGYPVNFYSGGDTTRDAFSKHIQEIERIYGCLNALDNGKVSADDMGGRIGRVDNALTEHINSTNPHPNWHPSVSWNDITDKPELGDLSGTIAASKVHGELTNATIDHSRVNGLRDFVEGLIPSDSSGGITDFALAENGYVKFSNGFMLQWGSINNPTDGATNNFPKAFPNACYVAVPYHRDAWFNCSVLDFYVTWTKSGIIMQPKRGSSFSGTLHYLAVGR